LRLPGAIEPVHEEGQRRGRDETEVRGAAGDEKRRAREGQSSQPRLDGAAGEPAGQQEHPESAERDIQQVDRVERADNAENRLQRQRQHVGEDRVVVQAEIGARVERKDAIGVERRSAAFDEFVPEDPGVPDVDTRVTGRLPGQMREQAHRQRPRLKDRHEDERGESACALPPGGRWHAGAPIL
jgi:hypothetical protein